ncbi:MAG: MFS transporter [Oligoflexia bacterium]|nr:MFS transporter [Oligoflexia bacterium]
MDSRRPSAFAIPDFRVLAQARFLFTFSVQIQAVVMGWQMYAIRKDPLYLGLIGLSEAVPALALALVSGYIVDRSSPLKVYRWVMALSLLSAALLLVVSSGLLGNDPGVAVQAIFAAAIITGTARGFAGPSMTALVPQLVPREILHVSAAWITSTFQIAAVTGPAAGGLLYSWKGATAPYLLECFMLLAGQLCLLRIRHRCPVNPAPATEPVWERLTSGIRFVFRHELLLAALSLDMFAVLFGGVTALLPIFASEVLRIGPEGLGLLRASPSAGALVMSAVLIRFPVSRGAGRLLLGVVTGFGFCMIGFALSRSLGLSVFFLALSGALDSVSMVIRGTIVQLCSPAEMRGRIGAVNSFFIGSSNEIGAFESGVAAKLLGTVPSVIFGGCMTLLTVAIVAWRAPRLRRVDLAKL